METENRDCCDAGSGMPEKKTLELRPKRSPHGESVGGDGTVPIRNRWLPLQSHCITSIRSSVSSDTRAGFYRRRAGKVAGCEPAANRGGTTGQYRSSPVQGGMAVFLYASCIRWSSPILRDRAPKHVVCLPLEVLSVNHSHSHLDTRRVRPCVVPMARRAISSHPLRPAPPPAKHSTTIRNHSFKRCA